MGLYLCVDSSKHLLDHLDHRVKVKGPLSLAKVAGLNNASLMNKCASRMGCSKDSGNPRMQTATIYCIDTAFLLQAKRKTPN